MPEEGKIQSNTTRVVLEEEEVVAIVEELSHRPYRNTHQMIGILSARLGKAREGAKIDTGGN